MLITCPHCKKRPNAQGPFPAAFWTEITCEYCKGEFDYRLGETRKRETCIKCEEKKHLTVCEDCYDEIRGEMLAAMEHL